jgi:hypothetical protein
MEKDNLEELRNIYLELQEKHNLPGFEEMNKDFGIEKLDCEKVELIIREIRRFIADKMLNYMRLIETILNPSNAPMFIFSLVKTFETKDKEVLNEIYKKLAKFELDLIILDAEYSEEKECDFIRNSFEMWQKIKKDLLNIFEAVKSNWDKEKLKQSKGYFG